MVSIEEVRAHEKQLDSTNIILRVIAWFAGGAFAGLFAWFQSGSPLIGAIIGIIGATAVMIVMWWISETNKQVMIAKEEKGPQGSND